MGLNLNILVFLVFTLISLEFTVKSQDIFLSFLQPEIADAGGGILGFIENPFKAENETKIAEKKPKSSKSNASEQSLQKSNSTDDGSGNDTVKFNRNDKVEMQSNLNTTLEKDTQSSSNSTNNSTIKANVEKASSNSSSSSETTSIPEIPKNSDFEAAKNSTLFLRNKKLFKAMKGKILRRSKSFANKMRIRKKFPFKKNITDPISGKVIFTSYYNYDDYYQIPENETSNKENNKTEIQGQTNHNNTGDLISEKGGSSNTSEIADPNAENDELTKNSNEQFTEVSSPNEDVNQDSNNGSLVDVSSSNATNVDRENSSEIQKANSSDTEKLEVQTNATKPSSSSEEESTTETQHDSIETKHEQVKENQASDEKSSETSDSSSSLEIDVSSNKEEASSDEDLRSIEETLEENIDSDSIDPSIEKFEAEDEESKSSEENTSSSNSTFGPSEYFEESENSSEFSIQVSDEAILKPIAKKNSSDVVQTKNDSKTVLPSKHSKLGKKESKTKKLNDSIRNKIAKRVKSIFSKKMFKNHENRNESESSTKEDEQSSSNEQDHSNLEDPNEEEHQNENSITNESESFENILSYKNSKESDHHSENSGSKHSKKPSKKHHISNHSDSGSHSKKSAHNFDRRRKSKKSKHSSKPNHHRNHFDSFKCKNHPRKCNRAIFRKKSRNHGRFRFIRHHYKPKLIFGRRGFHHHK